MLKSSYCLVKKVKYSKFIDLSIKEVLELKRKKDLNGNIKFYDEIIVNKFMKKTLDKRFKKLLELIINYEEDDDPNGLMLCLNETEKFKKEINNKLSKILDQKQREFNLKKIAVIEEDLKRKLIVYHMHKVTNNYLKDAFDEQNEMEEERHRRR